MMKLIYPAIFTPAEEGGYLVDFPDLESCFTEGDTLQEALEMAQDVLCLVLCNLENNSRPLPQPSNPANIQVKPGAFVSIVEADTDAYRKRNSTRAVKKTLTIPEWLNLSAEKAGVNFSQVLQDALKQRLGFTE